MLTLRYPFHRNHMSQYAENLDKEILVPPLIVAPHRDIHPFLSHIALKCLAFSPVERYQNVNEIIHDLKCYLNIQSDWVETTQLNFSNKISWIETKSMFLNAESTLFFSKTSYPDTIRIEAKVTFEEEGSGIGFILHANSMDDYDCLWLSSGKGSVTQLWLRQRLVLEAPEVILEKEKSYLIHIEQVNNNLYVYVDHHLKISYMGYIPPIHNRLGIMVKDTHHRLDEFKIFIDSKNLHDNPLKVPHAFLAHQEYTLALDEYRSLYQSLPDTKTGREAHFYSGITLLEHSRVCGPVSMRNSKIKAALKEFAKLHGTPSAPLEYLGRVLAYEALQDTKKEVETFEYVLKHFNHHPLIQALYDQLIYRLNMCLKYDHFETYPLGLLAGLYLPFESMTQIVSRVEQRLDPVYLFDDIDISRVEFHKYAFCTHLSFLLAKTQTLGEIVDDLLKMPFSHLQLLESTLLGLIELGSYDLAQEKLDQCSQLFLDVQAAAHLHWIQKLIQSSRGHFENVGTVFLNEFPVKWQKQHMHVVICLLNEALRQKKIVFVLEFVNQLNKFDLTYEQLLQIAHYNIWANLLGHNWEKANLIFQQFPSEIKKSHALHFLYQCWLKATKNNVDILPVLMEVSPFPWINNEIKEKYELFNNI